MAEALGAPQLSDSEFRQFQLFIYETAGIQLSDAKKALVAGRLAKRLKHYGLARYGQYFELLLPPAGQRGHVPGERQIAINLLTTNETRFFREPAHFDFIIKRLLPHWRTGQRRIWSAASSTGEEAYTLAMVLSEHLPNRNWEIIGTDINSQVLDTARSALYPLERAEGIPRPYLQQYCLKGIGSQQGLILMDRPLREHTRFQQANLQSDLSQLGLFELTLLRNVLAA
jgi:chemotaxis protein methyltransferase CheR